MKNKLILLLLLGLAATLPAQTVFEYDKKGNQISRSRKAKAAAEVAVSGDTVVHKGNAVRLVAKGGESYIWNTGESSPEIVVSPEATTQYFVSIRDVCKVETQDSVQVEVMDILAAPETREQVRFGVSPNPASSSATVVFELPRPGLSQIRLINAAGDVLLLREFSGENLSQTFLLDGYPSGNYFWSLWFEGAVRTQSFTILK